MEYVTFRNQLDATNKIIIRKDKIVSYVENGIHGTIYLDDESSYDVWESADDFKDIMSNKED